MAAAVAAAENEFYNILAIDGGSIKGILPAIVLGEMEKYAREYSNEKGYNVPVYTDYTMEPIEDRVHLSDLFDMFAGTSAGSILTGSYATPHETLEG